MNRLSIPSVRRLFLVALFLALPLARVGAQEKSSALEWTELPSVPDPIGLGGPFVGTHGGGLIVAGGANFPAGLPWEDGVKQWSGRIHVLPLGSDVWLSDFELPRPLAYGVAVSTAGGMLLFGGSDADGSRADAYRLRWIAEARRIEVDELPPLPAPSEFPAGGVIGQSVYILGGRRSADPGDFAGEFWRLDLSKPAAEQAWEVMAPFPGVARAKAVAAVQTDGAGDAGLYVFSGETSSRNAAGETELEYLTDTYRYTPDTGAGRWTRLTDSPRPVAAACAIDAGQSHVLVFSGSTGEFVDDPPETQLEFPARVLAYHTITDTWAEAGAMPRGVVTTGVTRIGERIIIASGEVRPGVRTPQVWAAELDTGSGGFGAVNFLVLGLYLAALVGVGVFFSRREKTADDFFLAGKRIPWWAAGLSIYATQLSAITFMGAPSVTYTTDWVSTLGAIMILVMAPIVIAFYLPFFCRLNLTTAYEYLERRFNLAVRLFGSLSFIAFQLGRIAIVVYLPALALAAITGIDVYVCIALMGVLAIVYTFLGGIEAVIWTDVVQAFVLLGGLIVSLAIAVGRAGGIGEVFSVASSAEKLNVLGGGLSLTQMATWSVLLGSFTLQFGPYTTDQAVIQRYLTTKDERSTARGIWLNGWLSVLVLPLFYVMGTALFAFFKARPADISVGAMNDQVFPMFIASQLPTGVSGLVIAAIFAASMSSLDSSMHSVSTTIVVDFFRRFRRGAGDSAELLLGRALVVVVGVLGVSLAMALASFDISSLLFFFQKMLGLLSNGLVGIFILGIFTRRATSAGALAGAIAGTAVTAYLTFASSLHFFLYSAVGIPTAVIVGYAVSLALPAKAPPAANLTIRS